MTKWKLYWVASDGYEDCFVVAKNSRSAKKIEKEMNDFEDEELTIKRVKDIPDKYEKIANEKFRKWSVKNNYNTHLDLETLEAWPYYAEDWLLKKLGAEFRFIEGKKQILIDDVVYAPNKVYPIGKMAMKELAELSGKKFMDISNVSYEGIEEAIDELLGKSIILIHKIEDDITNSFIFGVNNKKYQNYTINEATKYWKDKLTFGKLIGLMEENYIIDQNIRNALQLFLKQRNKIAHGLTKDERFDIDTSWGQKETIGFLCLFLKNAFILKRVTESARIASMSFGWYLVKDEKKQNKRFEKDFNEFHSDPYIQEQLGLFFSVFKLK